MDRKSTTNFPTSYRWSPYVTPKSSKGWLKKWIIFFANKIRCLLNKVCCKVSLCENFLRQGCSTIIPVSNSVWCWRETQSFNLNFTPNWHTPRRLLRYSGYNATGIKASEEVQLSQISTQDEAPIHYLLKSPKGWLKNTKLPFWE